MLDLAQIALMEEKRQAEGLADIATHLRPCCGGIAARGEPGAWVNTGNGMGLDGEPDLRELDDAILDYEAHGIEPRFEIAPFAHPILLKALEERRFSVRVFENTFFRALRAEVQSPLPVPPEVRVERIDPANAAQVAEYARVGISGFLPPDKITPEMIGVVERVIRHPRCICLAASIDGRMVGAGGCAAHGEIGGLFGLTVLPDQRRRGIQLAMMAARLNALRERGVRIATIASRPGVATERNARRMGFELAYTKVAMTRAGPGLAPVVG